MGFNIDIEGVLRGLADFEIRSRAALGIYADTSSKKLEKHAKENAPWTDDTGLARKTIKGGKEWDGEKCNIYVAGNMEYSPCLELCNDKKYAILKPTINKLSPEILKGLENLMRR